MKTVIIIDIMIIMFVAFIVGEIMKIFINNRESFINPSQMIKTCNRFKRKSRARIYNLKNNIEKNLKNKVQYSYKTSKQLMKKILFPKEIKIFF